MKCPFCDVEMLHGYLNCGNVIWSERKHKISTLPDEKETYTMHVLYEKNGWVFDTYNQRQYPVAKSIALHKGFVYKDFSYEDVKGLTYEEFCEKNYGEMAIWCKEHDCYQDWTLRE